METSTENHQQKCTHKVPTEKLLIEKVPTQKYPHKSSHQKTHFGTFNTLKKYFCHLSDI